MNRQVLATPNVRWRFVPGGRSNACDPKAHCFEVDGAALLAVFTPMQDKGHPR